MVKDLKAQLEATELMHYQDYRELTDEISGQVAYSDALKVRVFLRFGVVETETHTVARKIAGRRVVPSGL